MCLTAQQGVWTHFYMENCALFNPNTLLIHCQSVSQLNLPDFPLALLCHFSLSNSMSRTEWFQPSDLHLQTLQPVLCNYSGEGKTKIHASSSPSKATTEACLDWAMSVILLWESTVIGLKVADKGQQLYCPCWAPQVLKGPQFYGSIM